MVFLDVQVFVERTAISVSVSNINVAIPKGKNMILFQLSAEVGK